MAVAGHLKQPTRGCPSRWFARGWSVWAHLAAYLALLRLGVAVPPLLPAARWALTPPFHPYRPTPSRGPDGGLLSVALSVAFRRPGVTWQSALWSSDFPRITLAGAPRPSRSASVLNIAGTAGKGQSAIGYQLSIITKHTVA